MVLLRWSYDGRSTELTDSWFCVLFGCLILGIVLSLCLLGGFVWVLGLFIRCFDYGVMNMMDRNSE